MEVVGLEVAVVATEGVLKVAVKLVAVELEKVEQEEVASAVVA